MTIVIHTFIPMLHYSFKSLYLVIVKFLMTVCLWRKILFVFYFLYLAVKVVNIKILNFRQIYAIKSEWQFYILQLYSYCHINFISRCFEFTFF